MSMVRELHLKKSNELQRLRAQLIATVGRAASTRALAQPLRDQLIAELGERLKGGQLHKIWELAIADARENVEVLDAEAAALSTILIQYATQVGKRIEGIADELQAEQARLTGEAQALQKFVAELAEMLPKDGGDVIASSE